MLEPLYEGSAPRRRELLGFQLILNKNRIGETRVKRIKSGTELFNYFRSMGGSKTGTEIEIEGIGKFRIFFQSDDGVKPDVDSDEIVATEGEQFELWDTILLKVQQTISRPSFETWFTQTSAIRLDDHHIGVICQNSFQLDWLKSNFRHLLLTVLEEVVGEKMELEFFVGKSSVQI